MSPISNSFLLILFTAILSAVLLVYVWFIYKEWTKDASYIHQLRRFYAAAQTVYTKNLSPADSFMQLNLNYKEINHLFGSSEFENISALLEKIIYYYDSRPDKVFKHVFKCDKEPDVRDYIMDMCIYIRKEHPFISAPQKEADFMYTIKTALNTGNIDLGTNLLTQLSLEIEAKEKLLRKKDRDNQRATILSIVGIILTIIFGIISFLQFFF